MTSKRSATPLYRELARSLQHEIESGVHPVGTLLPPESDLCRRFGVSRHTAREALRTLRDRGLVARRQGSGTVVTASSVNAIYTQSLASISDLLQYAEATWLELGEGDRITVRGSVARMLGSAPGRHWMRFSGVRRTSEGSPVCTTDVYLDCSVFAAVADIGTGSGPIYKLIEQRTGVEVSEVRQAISAVSLEPRIAGALEATPGEPALRILRHYLDRCERVFEVSVSVHPADRFEYSMRIRRDSTG